MWTVPTTLWRTKCYRDSLRPVWPFLDWIKGCSVPIVCEGQGPLGPSGPGSLGNWSKLTVREMPGSAEDDAGNPKGRIVIDAVVVCFRLWWEAGPDRLTGQVRQGSGCDGQGLSGVDVDTAGGSHKVQGGGHQQSVTHPRTCRQQWYCKPAGFR